MPPKKSPASPQRSRYPRPPQSRQTNPKRSRSQKLQRSRRPAEAKGAGGTEGAPEAAGEARGAGHARGPGLRIVMVASEAHPFAKTGGLAEVLGALPPALARLGHDVTVILPRYRGVDMSGGTTADTVRARGRSVPVAFVEKPLPNGVTAVLVDVPDSTIAKASTAGRPGFPDNGWRFAVLARAALEYARLKQVRPSVFHVHDWQAGLVPVYQKMPLSDDPYVGGVPCVFTIHNLAFQGVFGTAAVPALGLGPDVLHVNALEYWGQISFIKGGINFSEKLTTVSPTYAREILTPEFGFGMQGVLQRRADDLVGILNGIDTERWNPANDAFVTSHFSARTRG